MENLQPSAVTGPVTETERTYIVDALNTTRDNLHQSLSGLTDTQLVYKPTPDRWSIAECVEHIALVEKGILRAIQAGMSVSADAAKRSEIKLSDVDVIKATRSRVVTLAAPTPFMPTGRYGDAKASLQVFDDQRAAALAFTQAVQDDLRTHFFVHPAFGTLDLYQALLVMVSHVARHTKQIEEVKASAGFSQ
jgi:hypothetical protein